MQTTSDPTFPMPLSVRFHEALAYENPQMVTRYARRHSLAAEEAQRLFLECKKFLIVAALFPEPCTPSRAIDQMWHHFILHTRDYAEYCAKYLGGFVHHRPSEAPHAAHRAEMLAFAERLFGRIDRDLWPRTGAACCDTSR